MIIVITVSFNQFKVIKLFMLLKFNDNNRVVIIIIIYFLT